jgi:hypothetical protein
LNCGWRYIADRVDAAAERPRNNHGIVSGQLRIDGGNYVGDGRSFSSWVGGGNSASDKSGAPTD